MYAAFDPSFNERINVAENPLGEIALVRQTVLRIVGAESVTIAEAVAHSPANRRKSRFASLSSGMIRVEEKAPQYRLPTAKVLAARARQSKPY